MTSRMLNAISFHHTTNYCCLFIIIISIIVIYDRKIILFFTLFFIFAPSNNCDEWKYTWKTCHWGVVAAIKALFWCCFAYFMDIFHKKKLSHTHMTIGWNFMPKNLDRSRKIHFKSKQNKFRSQKLNNG